MSSILTPKFDIKLHPSQTLVFSDPSRFKVMVTGRRWGKTQTVKAEIIKQAMTNASHVIWYVAPTYGMAKRIMWSELKESIPHQFIKYKSEVDLIIRLWNGSEINLFGADKPDCYDGKTEILTENGWIKFPELTENIDVLTLNPETLTAEWQRPYKYVNQYYKGPAYSIKNKKLDLIVTPEHKFLVESRKGFKKIKTIEAISGSDKIPAAIGWIGNDDVNITNEDATLMGYFLSEGSVYGSKGGDITKRNGNYEVTICQKPGVKGGNKGNVWCHIKETLDKSRYNYHTTKVGFTILNKQLWTYYSKLGNCYTKYIPKEYKELPPTKLRCLLHALLMGDGAMRDKGWEYYSVSKRLCDDIQEVACKAGYSATVRLKKDAGFADVCGSGRISKTVPIYSVSIFRNKYNYFQGNKNKYISEIDFEGRVYCVGVKNHVIMVRRNGKMCWSGNTLRGSGVNLLCLDEYQDFKTGIFEKILYPTLTDRKGRVVIAGCVVAGTMVMDRNGFRTIGSFSRNSSAKTLDPLSHELYGINKSFHTADGFWNNGSVDTKIITTRNGFQLEAAHIHPVLVMGEDGKQQWKKSSELKLGDRMAIDRGMEVWGNKSPLSTHGGPYHMTSDLAYFMGLWIAEGSLEGARIGITSGDNVGEIINHIFPNHFHETKKSEKCSTWRRTDHDLLATMKALDMPLVKAPFKRLPNWLTSGKREWAANFIAGMWDGDGYCCTGIKRIGYSSASEELVRGLQLLLTNFDIISRVTCITTPPTDKVRVESVQWRLTINGRNVDKFRENFSLRINRKQDNLNNYPKTEWSRRDGLPCQSNLLKRVRNSQRRLNQNIKIKRGSFEAAFKGSDISYRTLEMFLNSHLRTDEEAFQTMETNLRNRYYWDEVTSLDDGHNLTYDFTVPETHSFWSNGFISHNTPKSYNLLYDLYMRGFDPKWTKHGWKSWQFVTADNPFIPLDEIEQAKRNLDPKSFQQEFLASFETMDGKVYYAFERKRHAKDFLSFNPKLPIWIGQDFNINPMSTIIMQPQPNGQLWIVDELFLRDTSTHELAEALENKFYKPEIKKLIEIYPDPAGSARGHTRGESDLDILRQQGFRKIFYRRKHTMVADRINAVNRMFLTASGESRLYISAHCVELIKSLEQTVYKEGTREVNKKLSVEHMADALGYVIDFRFPIKRKQIYGVSR